MENKADDLSITLQEMQTNLKKVAEEHLERTWLQTGKNNLNEKLRGDKTLSEISQEIIEFLALYTEAQIGTVYVYEEDMLHLLHAFGINEKINVSFRMGEGLIGQVAVKKTLNVLQSMPKNYFRIESSLGRNIPDSIAILPAVFDNKTSAVIELAKFGEFTPIQLRLLEEVSESIAICINTVVGKKNLEKLVEQLNSKEQELSNQINAINISNATIEFDMNGIILDVNENFLNIMGYKEHEVVGKAHSIFVENSYALTKEYRQFWESLKKGEFKQDEFKRIHKNGESVWLQGSYNPILNEAGKPAKILKIFTDVTQARKQVLELAQQAEEKEKRAAELVIANEELAYQNDEKEKRAAELAIANKELAYQNNEKEKRAAELIIANKELAYQAQEKENRAAELVVTNKELAYQAEVLQAQKEELKQMNEELEQQAQNLKQQQEELQMSNEELSEQTQSLEEKNREVEAAKDDIEQKTKQLEISSKYKSEFLANMSHELRTPLNSLLILSKDLSENRQKNLDAMQVESAEIIYRSGHDLLVLINEVLDLSKIEAGKMSINIERVALQSFSDDLVRNFKHQAELKGLKLISKLDNHLPESIRTDLQRLNQIMKNLLSNAIKFTAHGSVSVFIERYSESQIVISVTDTGIGIPEDKQTGIFEAFQQADGGTSRKYGGTGLGLSISRELARLLGVEIKLKSRINEGSTFSLYIPLDTKNKLEPAKSVSLTESLLYKSPSKTNPKYIDYPCIEDDREAIIKDDKVVLIIEDDMNFAAVLLKQANKKKFKCLLAATGEDGLDLATKYRPQAIILDMELPGINGHEVLLELKANPSIRHIPVHVISGHDVSLIPIKEGAIEYLQKPVNKGELDLAFDRIENFVNRKVKNLLIVEDNENSRKAMKKLIGEGDVKCFEASTGKEALAIYKEQPVDCLIIDLGLPDISGFELIRKLEKMKKRALPPIIIYTGKELSREENDELQHYAESIIIKGVKSEDKLLDETALFLHRTIGKMPKSKQLIIHNLYDKEALFHTKKILLVDDDQRNVLALSKILVERGMEIIRAENGKKALEMLTIHSDIHLVLMDIMMPEMDGYEAMRHIRSNIKFRSLPVIALTAKAMKDDRQKCIDAGANDYITKPIDLEQLLSLMRVWLSK